MGGSESIIARVLGDGRSFWNLDKTGAFNSPNHPRVYEVQLIT